MATILFDSCSPGRPVSANLELDEDGLLRRVVPLHSVRKLHYVRRIAQMTATAMKNKWPRRVYIELFAGPGRCRIAEQTLAVQGSPLLAVTVPDAFTDYHFVDIRPDVIDSLRSRVSIAAPGANVSYYAEDCNTAVGKIVGQLPPRFLGLAFIDPTNWQVRFETLRQLALSSPQMDLLLTFHTGQMKRTTHIPSQPNIDAYFGDDGEWHTAFVNNRRFGTRALADYYKQRLSSLGYLTAEDEVIVKNSRQSLQYLLIYASRHQLGIDFWRKAAMTGPDGERTLGLGI